MPYYYLDLDTEHTDAEYKALEEAVAEEVLHERTGLLRPWARNAAFGMEVFVAALERLGVASIHADMEDAGREPGQIVLVCLGQHVAFGPLSWAICTAALEAVRCEQCRTGNTDHLAAARPDVPESPVDQ
jgi:hypothetical protein